MRQVSRQRDPKEVFTGVGNEWTVLDVSDR